jgi:hypothetical protein
MFAVAWRGAHLHDLRPIQTLPQFSPQDPALIAQAAKAGDDLEFDAVEACGLLHLHPGAAGRGLQPMAAAEAIACGGLQQDRLGVRRQSAGDSVEQRWLQVSDVILVAGRAGQADGAFHRQSQPVLLVDGQLTQH